LEGFVFWVWAWQKWFRELPKGVLDELSPEAVLRCRGEKETLALIKQLPSTEAALLDWALNLMADVAEEEASNKMNARSIATIFAPNMTKVNNFRLFSLCLSVSQSQTIFAYCVKGHGHVFQMYVFLPLCCR
jgi:hypothetical protein